jgi:predicted nucleic acid-binding protein
MSQGPVFVDTDVLVDYLRGVRQAVEAVTSHQARIALSAVVVAELYAGVKGEKEQAQLDAFVSLFRVAPVTAAIARRGGLHRRNYRQSHGVGLPDALLAATAESEHAELLTLNVRHFPMLKGLAPAYVKES